MLVKQCTPDPSPLTYFNCHKPYLTSFLYNKSSNLLALRQTDVTLTPFPYLVLLFLYIFTPMPNPSLPSYVIYTACSDYIRREKSDTCTYPI